MTKLWGGRFNKKTSGLVDDFHSSIHFDSRLYRYDIEGSKAHAEMLGRAGIITPEEAAAIVAGLGEVLSDIEGGRAEFSVEAEDIHMNVEQMLTEKIGPVAKKLHTARSRNDQVALDMRMYLREQIGEIVGLIDGLREVLAEMAEGHLHTIMPGYTHLQRAQPVTLAHHLMAYVQMFGRDRERLLDCRRRVNVMPLGAGALAGTTFPLDPEYVARRLGFEELARNSLDAVSDRDFAVEFTAVASLIMVHLSRFCEEIVIWSSGEFSFIELDDQYSTGSSMMPQKKNPDVAELIRGKAGRVFGDLTTLLTMLKGLPLAYNKDMQEDKEALFDALDTVKKCLEVFIPMLATVRVKEENMFRAARGGFTNATDLADYLVRKGAPFREAHEIVGKTVLYCMEAGKSLEQLSLEEFGRFSPLVEEDVYEYISIQRCVEARRTLAGPSPESVREAILRSGLGKGGKPEKLNRV